MRGYGIIVVTLLVSLVLSIWPVPDSLQLFRPQWTALVLIYWCMAVPEKVGVGVGFVVGLLLDILTGTLLGQHALGLSVVAFLTIKTYRRLRVFPLWQQALTVTFLLAVERLFFFWVDGTIGRPARTYESWLAPLIGGITWMWLYIILRDLRRRFHPS